MTASSVAQQAANELSALTSDQPHLSEFMLQLAQVCARNMTEAAPLYRSFQMWGGPGSFADQAGIDLTPEGRARTNDLIIELFEEFERHGIHYERAVAWVKAFREWQDRDVFRKMSS